MFERATISGSDLTQSRRVCELVFAPSGVAAAGDARRDLALAATPLAPAADPCGNILEAPGG